MDDIQIDACTEELEEQTGCGEDEVILPFNKKVR